MFIGLGLLITFGVVLMTLAGVGGILLGYITHYRQQFKVNETFKSDLSIKMGAELQTHIDALYAEFGQAQEEGVLEFDALDQKEKETVN